MRDNVSRICLDIGMLVDFEVNYPKLLHNWNVLFSLPSYSKFVDLAQSCVICKSLHVFCASSSYSFVYIRIAAMFFMLFFFFLITLCRNKRPEFTAWLAEVKKVLHLNECN